LHSQTVDPPDTEVFAAPATDAAVDVAVEAAVVAAVVAAVDEHAAARSEAASSPPAIGAKRAGFLDRQVTCISRIRCSLPLDGH
jgi:hypothetical protein